MKKALLAVLCLSLLVGSFFVLSNGITQVKAGYELDVVAAACSTVTDY